MTLSERERKIEAATNVLYEYRVRSPGISCATLAQKALDAAEEAVPVVRRERMAFAFREWIHESPLSKCSMGADECLDWPLAYELADLALGVVSSVSGEAEADA